MTGARLKTIAILSMLIDHVGAVLFPDFIFLRVIGRLAFPIFAYMLVQGYLHTSDKRKYALRLLAFGIISEVPFDLAFFGKVTDFGHQNIFFTLALGILAMWLFEKGREKHPSAGWLLVLIVAVVSEYLRVDYGVLGIFTIMFFFENRNKPGKGMFQAGLLHVIYGILGSNLLAGAFIFAGFVQAFAVFSMLLIWLYNGEKGKGYKYAFYAFYPVHLMLLALVDYLT